MSCQSPTFQSCPSPPPTPTPTHPAALSTILRPIWEEATTCMRLLPFLVVTSMHQSYMGCVNKNLSLHDSLVCTQFGHIIFAYNVISIWPTSSNTQQHNIIIDLKTFKQGFIRTFSEKNCSMIFRKWGGTFIRFVSVISSVPYCDWTINMFRC